MEKVNILLASGDLEILKPLKTYLSARHRVFTAMAADEITAIIPREEIDIAIIDVGIAKKNGFELLKTIRKNLNKTEIALIAKSHDIKTVVEATYFGAYDFISDELKEKDAERVLTKGIKRLSQTAHHIPRKRIGEILVDKGSITPEQLEEALIEKKKSGNKLGAILISRGAIGEEEIAQNLSEQLDFLYADVTKIKADEEAVRLIPVELARKFQIMPLFRVDNTLIVAMFDPLDIQVLDDIRDRCKLSLHVRSIISTPSAISEAINRHYGSGPAGKGKGEEAAASDGEGLDLIKAATRSPVIDFVNGLIKEAVEARASDIHLEPEKDDFFCRYRIDGMLYDFPPPAKNLQAAIISRIKIMAGMDIAEKRLPQDGRIRIEIEGKDLDMRISTFPTVYGENVSMRILDKTQGLYDIDGLGFLPDTAGKLKNMIHKPHGMILVTGPTSCGKTTTLYAILSAINTTSKNIVTLEDPIEYMIPRIRQSQISPKAGLTFATGLRSLVRQDPNVIMIGEIRDMETADIAIHSALTGHLVFSTLHTNDAPSAATRLIDMGVEPFLVSSSFAGVIAQRLVRKLCPECKEKYHITREELVSFGFSAKDAFEDMDIYRETGCKECNDIGYKGRIGIFELMVMNQPLSELINKKVPTHELREAAVKAGMKSLREDGFAKIKQGNTTVSEVLRVTQLE